MQKIFTTANAKIQKGTKFGYLTVGIHFAPASESGFNVCPGSSVGCRAACLATAGHGAFQTVQSARVKKTVAFKTDTEAFLRQCVKELTALKIKAENKGLKLAVRLNLTSDIAWEHITLEGKTLFEIFSDVEFYDYTKIVNRMLPGSKARSFANYHLTFSLSEENGAKAELVAKAGGNVAVVFRPHLPTEFWGRPVIDGDISDLRFTDGHGVIVGLKAKGRARKDNSGFVIDVA